MTILYFIIAIGILILVHELGHFIIARMSGIRVEKFSIGFGPKIFGFKRGETEYKIAPIPLGGYVKMTGEDPDDAASATDEHSFANKSVWTRIKVVGAGPAMNILFALIFMPLAFYIGRMNPAYLDEEPVIMGVKRDSPAFVAGLQAGDLLKSIDGMSVKKWDDVLNKLAVFEGKNVNMILERNGIEVKKEVAVSSMPELKGGYVGIEPIFFLGNEARIGHVMEGGAAKEAGIKAGDKVIAMDGMPVEGWFEMSLAVNNAGGRVIDITVDRDGQKLVFNVKPVYNESHGRWMIDIRPDRRPDDIPMVKKRYGIIESVKLGVKEFVILLELTIEVLKKLFTLELSYKSLGGPIQIAQISAVAARYGLGEFIYFLAFLSIQLGILNLLPIPILDGGHVAFCGIEAIIRRPIPTRIKVIAQYCGMVILISLFTLVTINDINSVWGIKKLIGKLFR